MIKVKVSKKGTSYQKIEISGHAEYADPGFDIFCAAVSVLTINTANSLEKFTEENFEAEERDGFVSMRFHGDNTPEGRLLLDSMLLGLTSIEDNYNGKYLKINIKEV